MKEEGDTRQKLLVSAKAEFMEKGFMQASLRSICKNAGVTTGALYFFFRDKEDLYANLVEEPLETLIQLLHQHFLKELQQEDVAEFLSGDYSSDLEAARKMIYYMYQNYDVFLLLLQKSQGSKFENAMDRFITISERHCRMLADKIVQHFGISKVDSFMIHWVSHMLIDSFVYILTHEQTLEAALTAIEPMVCFMMTGWLTQFQEASTPEGRKHTSYT